MKTGDIVHAFTGAASSAAAAEAAAAAAIAARDKADTDREGARAALLAEVHVGGPIVDINGTAPTVYVEGPDGALKVIAARGLGDGSATQPDPQPAPAPAPTA